MRLPKVEITEFTYRIKQDLGYISEVVNSEQVKKSHPQLHKENTFNRRYSAALGSFSDLRVIAERLSENIDKSVELGRKMQEKDEIDQDLHRQYDKLTEQNKVDLKSLYVHAKIFCDDFVTLLIFLFNWRGIADRSITRFYSSLSTYKGDDEQLKRFIDKCLSDIKQIDEFVTDYRDNAIVHNQHKHKEKTVWFVNEMDGRISFKGGNYQSVTPQEVTFLVSYFVEHSRDFILEEFDFVLE